MSYLRAFSTLGCAELSPLEALALAERHGLAGVELRAAGGTVELLPYLAHTYGSPAALAQAAAGFRPRIVLLATSVRLTGVTEADHENLLGLASWAEGLGVRWLRVFDGDSGRSPAGEKEALETLRWWRQARAARNWNVNCLVETHDSLLDAAGMARFAAAAPDIGILWDTHHTWKKRGEDPGHTWRASAPCVAHIHVKDSVPTPHGNSDYTYVLPAQGKFPMAPLARALAKDYRGIVSLEWERLWHPELPPLDQALAAAAAAEWW